MSNIGKSIKRDLQQERIVMNANLPAERLTKREQFAMAAMQGNIKAFHDCDVTDFGEMASDCVLIADALLAELAKVKS